jgi:ABC-type glycerol-3-phosphate transport system permease component
MVDRPVARPPVAPLGSTKRHSGRPGRFSLSKPLVYLLLVTYFLIVVYPMFWLFYSSLKSDQEIFLTPFALPTTVHWENFSSAWIQGHFREYFANSVIMTVSTVLATTLLAAMTAYAVARFTFAGSRAVYFYFLAGLMIPLQLAIVPLFFQMKTFGMLDTRWGLFVVYLAFGFPFSVFVLTGFFKSLPASLHESALLDGATEWQAFWHIMLPLARPGLITVAIFLFLGNWNEFFVAFMTLSGGRPAPGAGAFQQFAADPRTLPLGIANITIVSNYRSDWGMAFAGLVLMMLPTLLAYMLLQKHLTKGITAGAVKG